MTHTVSALATLFRKANYDLYTAIAFIPDGGYEAAPSAPQPEPEPASEPLEWTKYPPPRDPFAEKDSKQ